MTSENLFNRLEAELHLNYTQRTTIQLISHTEHMPDTLMDHLVNAA